MHYLARYWLHLIHVMSWLTQWLALDHSLASYHSPALVLNGAAIPYETAWSASASQKQLPQFSPAWRRVFHC